MDSYIVCDKSKIIGSIFQYKDGNNKNINFYYTSYNDCFTMFIDGMPVCFRFKDIKYSKEVEVYAPNEYKYEFDYELLFSTLKQSIIYYPIVQYVKDSFPLDNTKIEFIKNNCESLSIVQTEDDQLMLDIKLPRLEELDDLDDYVHPSKLPLSDISVFSDKSKEITKDADDEKRYYNIYNQVITCLQDSFKYSGLSLMLGSTISKNEGLKFYIVNDFSESDKSSIVNLHIADSGTCSLSNFYLTGSLIPLGLSIVKGLEKLCQLDFINSMTYSTTIDNKLYNNLSKLGYNTDTGILVPKSPMVKIFNKNKNKINCIEGC